MRLLLAAAVSLMLAAALVGPFAYADGPSNPTWTREQRGGEVYSTTFPCQGSCSVYPTPGATPNGNERAITVCSMGQQAYVCLPTPNGTATPSPCTTPNGSIIPGGTCQTYRESVKGRYVQVLSTPAATATYSILIEK